MPKDKATKHINGLEFTYHSDLSSWLPSNITVTNGRVSAVSPIENKPEPETPYKGTFYNEEDFPKTSKPGDYLDLDSKGIGTPVRRYIWDDNDQGWVSLATASATSSSFRGIFTSTVDFPINGYPGDYLDLDVGNGALDAVRFFWDNDAREWQALQNVADLIWGKIEGDITSQADLVNALAAKSDSTHTHTIGSLGGVEEAPIDGSQYVRKNGTWVVISVAGGTVPNGGLTNQVLSKNSNADQDFGWNYIDADAGTF